MTLVTVPNLLSVSRVILIPALAGALLQHVGWLSIMLFGVVVVSDILDGYVARKTRQASIWGARLDHGSDAIFVTAITGVFAYLGLLPVLLPCVIAVAFSQYSIDSTFTGNPGLRSSKIGRWNGIAYFVITGLAIFVHVFVTHLAIRELLATLGMVLVVTTMISIIARVLYFLKATRES
jgi:phosphatidylglycerophosphate synthase